MKEDKATDDDHEKESAGEAKLASVCFGHQNAKGKKGGIRNQGTVISGK